METERKESEEDNTKKLDERVKKEDKHEEKKKINDKPEIKDFWYYALFKD